MDGGQPLARQNNFDLLRLAFALMVCGVHSHELSRNETLAPLTTFLSSGIALHGFFVISGFLITQSCEKSRSLGEYFVKRFRRIYPAYAAVIVVCLVGGLFITTISPGEYLASRQTWRYLVANLAFLNFLQPSLPGVFSGNGFSAVNGALWSIRAEVIFYFLAPTICVASRRVSPWIVCTAIYLGCVAFSAASLSIPGEVAGVLFHKLRVELLTPLACFSSGALLHYCFVPFRNQCWRLLMPALGLLIFTGHWPHAEWLDYCRPLCLAVVVISAAIALPHLGNWGRFGDFSYGVYISHFPIVQTLVAAGLFATHPWWALCLALALSGVAACLSWHLVEKRFLRTGSHYLLAAARESFLRDLQEVSATSVPPRFRPRRHGTGRAKPVS